jgi:hypothetical protein
VKTTFCLTGDSAGPQVLWRDIASIAFTAAQKLYLLIE